MPVTKSNLKRHAGAVVAVDFTTADIGGAIGDELSGSAPGETFFEMPSTEAGSGDGDRVQYGKEFIANNHADEDLINGKIWIPNALDDFGAGMDTMIGFSDSEDDDSTKFLRYIGLDVSGDPVTYDVNMDGLDEVVTLDQMTWVSRVTCHLVSSGDLTPTAGTVTLKRGNGTVLGVIPAGYFSASNEVKIALSATLDDTVTISDAADTDDDLSGYTFSRPRTLADAISCANSGRIPGGSAQGYFLELTVREGMPPSLDVEYLPAIAGQAEAVA